MRAHRAASRRSTRASPRPTRASATSVPATARSRAAMAVATAASATLPRPRRTALPPVMDATARATAAMASRATPAFARFRTRTAAHRNAPLRPVVTTTAVAAPAWRPALTRRRRAYRSRPARASTTARASARPTTTAASMVTATKSRTVNGAACRRAKTACESAARRTVLPAPSTRSRSADDWFLSNRFRSF